MDEYIWTQMFCAIAGWQFHPGQRHGALSIEECAAKADEMFACYLERKEKWKWAGWQLDKLEHHS